jgi:hypothetical protein
MQNSPWMPGFRTLWSFANFPSALGLSTLSDMQPYAKGPIIGCPNIKELWFFSLNADLASIARSRLLSHRYIADIAVLQYSFVGGIADAKHTPIAMPNKARFRPYMQSVFTPQFVELEMGLLKTIKSCTAAVWRFAVPVVGRCWDNSSK